MQRVRVTKGQIDGDGLVVEQADFPEHAIDVLAIVAPELFAQTREILAQQRLDERPVVDRVLQLAPNPGQCRRRKPDPGQTIAAFLAVETPAPDAPEPGAETARDRIRIGATHRPRRGDADTLDETPELCLSRGEIIGIETLHAKFA